MDLQATKLEEIGVADNSTLKPHFIILKKEPNNMNTTYKNVIDQFKLIADKHLAIKHFAVGQISDIEIPNDTAPKGIYPYVFLNPTTASIGQRSITYNFNLIVCDMAKDSEDLESRVHNTTIQILQDILAVFKLTTRTQSSMDIQLPADAIWFVESYKNSVAGWNCPISVTVTSPLDLCDAPFSELPIA